MACALGVVLASALEPVVAEPARGLSFADRVAAQEAIEQVYRRHRIAAPPEEVAPIAREVLERKVRTYLEQSAALDLLWHEPVTAEALRRELERIARDTRFPDRLQEIYDALGRDSVLIQECFARPVLADRLARNRQALEPTIRVGWEEWLAGVRPRLHPERVAAVAEALESLPLARSHGRTMAEATNSCLPEGTWTPTSQAGAPQARTSHAAVWTGSEMVVWGGRNQVDSNSLRDGGRYDPLTDSWTPTTLVNAPSARRDPIAVWTGQHVLVYSGEFGSNTGGRYDPATDAWLPVSPAGAPAPWISTPTATWTGNRLFMFGYRTADFDAAAAWYHPATDTWTAISVAGAPLVPLRGTVVWTGSRAIFFGGSNGSSTPWDDTGTMFDPASGVWSTISQQDPATPRIDHDAVWTGTRMLIWGGSHGANLAAGKLYDPIADRWSPMTLSGVPQATRDHSALWTGDRFIVWGGDGLDTGGIYDPGTDTWTATSTVDAPLGRSNHTAVWTGGEMIVWGGSVPFIGTLTGGLYALGQSDDRDGDGVSVCAGDCDDTDAAVHPGAVEICDGRDNDCDGVLLPAETIDGDLDLAPACIDCDDSNPERYPGGLEFCDGIDNDCDSVIDGTDADADGSTCTNDCDDYDAATYPGAPETNDGVDNQCPGDEGYGVVDELTGPLSFPSGSGTLCWPAQAGATLYEVLRADDSGMTSGCVLATSASACSTDLAAPPSRGVHALLVRAAAPRVGSWGVSSTGVERVGLCGQEWFCDDGDDEDVDGLTDCADIADCYGTSACPSTQMSFLDGPGDDATSNALEVFLSAVPATSGDFVHFSLSGPSLVDFEWCAERADFYKSSYLNLAPVAGTAISGAWNKWYRSEGSGWSAPETAGHDNWFGDDCVGPFSWCAEVGLGGHIPGVAPSEVGVCEAFDDISCSNGTWTFTLRIGVDRLAACGF